MNPIGIDMPVRWCDPWKSMTYNDPRALLKSADRSSIVVSGGRRSRCDARCTFDSSALKIGRIALDLTWEVQLPVILLRRRLIARSKG
ncbi:uncharacterized protein LOC105423865 [Pogonomyrmex barbatus]|uniref:Uncharacterized protein LOC105423865 n=1 Tax=Pogonomyrmex barbatus TaxID=144034 RepID=A0A8N1S3B8_9HYME|nr:uncharacterized protein LOC105423865 [Pogonomyrmex barbatus]